jgi:hypothetical protein
MRPARSLFVVIALLLLPAVRAEAQPAPADSSSKAPEDEGTQDDASEEEGAQDEGTQDDASRGEGAQDDASEGEGADEPELTPYQVHMNNGVRLFKAQLWDGAIAEFQAAYKAEPKASPLINLALTHKKLANPVKAIDVLEMALRKHRDTMPADQVAAAEREIKEMKALLAYVAVKVKPSLDEVELFVDDQPYPKFSTGDQLVLPPGMRTFRARAEGYAQAEQRVQIISGKDNAPVVLELAPTHGEVIITARHADAWIEVDSAKKAKGLHRQMLPPGVHVIRVLRGDEVDSIQIVVQPGERYAVTQDEDGELESDATAPLEQPPKDGNGFGPDVPEYLRGFYGLGGAAYLTAAAEVPTVTLESDDRFGAAVALHIGYRVSDWAGFEVFGQYSDIRVGGKLERPGTAFDNRGVTMVLKSLRLGALLRVMLPGDGWVRFVGNIGGGATIEDLEWRDEPVGEPIYFDHGGVGPFGQLDVGIEFEYQKVLIDIVFQSIVQGTKHFDTETDENVFDTKPIAIIGPAVRVGYALW